MLGESAINPYFDDGNYLIRFSRHTLKVAYTTGKSVDTWELPCLELVKHIDKLFSQEEDGEIDLDLELKQWKVKYGPNVKVLFDEGVEQTLANDVCHPLLVKKVEFISRLKNIAAGYSNGNPIVIAVYFDGKKRNDKPNDYYWEIRKEGGERIMNGGYIAHLVGNNQYEYAIHT